MRWVKQLIYNMIWNHGLHTWNTLSKNYVSSRMGNQKPFWNLDKFLKWFLFKFHTESLSNWDTQVMMDDTKKEQSLEMVWNRRTENPKISNVEHGAQEKKSHVFIRCSVLGIVGVSDSAIGTKTKSRSCINKWGTSENQITEITEKSPNFQKKPEVSRENIQTCRGYCPSLMFKTCLQWWKSEKVKRMLGNL